MALSVKAKNALLVLAALGTLVAATVGSMWLDHRHEIPPESWQAVVSRVESDQVCIVANDDQDTDCLPPQRFWPSVDVGQCASATWKPETMFPTIGQIDCPA